MVEPLPANYVRQTFHVYYVSPGTPEDAARIAEALLARRPARPFGVAYQTSGDEFEPYAIELARLLDSSPPVGLITTQVTPTSYRGWSMYYAIETTTAQAQDVTDLVIVVVPRVPGSIYLDPTAEPGISHLSISAGSLDASPVIEKLS